MLQLQLSLDLLGGVREALRLGFLPTLRAIFKTPSLLFHPQRIAYEYMYHVWAVFGPGIDENAREVKSSFLTPNAYGTVLDIGAGEISMPILCSTTLIMVLLSRTGYGHTAKDLDPSKVTKYIALEPNTAMHAKIREIAGEAGFSEDAGTLLIVPYGAEEIGFVISALGGPHTIDTVTSVLSLCSVPKPQETMQALSERALKPGGQLLFYEHVVSRRSDVALMQRLWTPVWSWSFGGCCLDRPTDIWLENLDIWESKDLWDEAGESEERLFWHRGGKLVKAS